MGLLLKRLNRGNKKIIFWLMYLIPEVNESSNDSQFQNFDSFMLLTLGSYITSSDYIRSARQRTRLMISLKYTFSKADMLLTPGNTTFFKKCIFAFQQDF